MLTVDRNKQTVAITIQLNRLNFLNVVACLALHHYSVVLSRKTMEFFRLACHP